MQAICDRIATLKEYPHSKLYFMLNKYDNFYLHPFVSWDDTSSKYLITMKYSDSQETNTTRTSQPYPILAKNSENRFYIAFEEFQGFYKQDFLATEHETVKKLLEILNGHHTICVIGSKNNPLQYSADASFSFQPSDIMT